MGSTSTSTGTVWMSRSCLLLLLVCSSFHCNLAARHRRLHQQQPPPPVVVVGSVHSGSNPTNAISGALVAVQCVDATGRAVLQHRAVTDRSGAFQIQLPPELSRHLTSIASCSLQLIQPNTAPCTVPSVSTTGPRFAATSKHGHGTCVFSAGAFAVRPEVCSRKGILFPPIPFVPEPPNIGGVPIPPNPVTPAPPPLLPPLVPSPSPPPLLPPLNPPSPPPPLINIPPVLPFLAPPPPPPPPKLPVLPPLPLLPPTPLVPGVPPTSGSKKGPESP